MSDSCKVHLIPGSLVERRVDVLVNVTNANLDLDKGALSKTILKSAGRAVQQECKTPYHRKLEPGDVVVTGAGDLRDAHAIYHAMVPYYDRRHNTENVLYGIVMQCLTKASADRFHSIAFPTLGTGCHRFPAKVVAETMMSAIKSFDGSHPESTLNRIEIVVFRADSSRSGEEIWMEFTNQLENLNPEKPGKQIERKSHKVELPMHLQLARRHQPSCLAAYTKALFNTMYKEDIRVPKYWTSVKGGKLVRECRTAGHKDFVLENVDAVTGNTIEQLVQMTWEGATKFSFGLGRRAKKLRLTKIQRIENLQLYKEYAQDRQNVFDKALKNDRPFLTVGQTRHSSGEVKTHEILFRNPLLSDTFPEINEHYLFHGTSRGNIESVLSQGLDNRLAGWWSKFGAGVYAAESSTKADEYTDDSDVGLKMLLVRICLGDIFVCNRRTNFSRAPCKSCSKDRCTCNHGFHDSVMADGESRFREFIVYDKRQVYPEYLITYNKV